MTAPQVPRPLVSVVVTAHNEAEGICATLLALSRQTGFPDGGIEVILVDDRSTDATIDRAREVAFPGLRILRHIPDPKIGLTTRQGALDQGFRDARGDVILTLDADSRVPRDWAAQISAPILEGRVDAVAGPVGFHPVRGALSGWQNCDAAYYLTVCAWFDDLGLPGGAMFGNFAFRTEMYDEIGGFGAIGSTLTEDRALARVFHQRDAALAFAPASQRVDVSACGSVPALLDRVLRVSSGPFSALALALTLWPLTLAIAAVWAMLTGGVGIWLIFAARYLAGVALVLHGLRRFGPWRAARFAPLYEIGAYAVAAGAFARWVRRRQVRWGGQLYDR